MSLRRKFCKPRYLVLLLFALYIFVSRPVPTPAEQRPDQRPPNLNFSSVVQELGHTRSIEPGSLTAVLPVTLTSLTNLLTTLDPLLSPPSCVSKVLLVCPESLLSQARAVVRQAVRSSPEASNHPDVLLYPWPGDPTVAVLHAATQSTTEWMLLLDETGLGAVSARTRDALTCPVTADLPVGPRGVIGSPSNWSCAPPSLETRPALYLLPPFTLPGSLVQGHHENWSDLGRAVSQSREDQLGGVVRSFGDPDFNWCNDGRQYSTPTTDPTLLASSQEDPNSLFVILLPNINDLRFIVPLVCRLHNSALSVKILLYSESRVTSEEDIFSGCQFQYDTIWSTERLVSSMIYDWLDRMGRKADIIFTVSEPATQSLRSEHATIVRIPRQDLEHVHWMGSLSLVEWKNWHVPQLEVNIITQDRPQSLERLLGSLSQARFFGDSVSLRMNMEQSSDLETIRVVDAYQWNHGSVFTHRRVVHGGLLTAVVESWYPHSNDSYGLILEDDIELSPLFYAWIKMGILRYRYGRARNETAQLFGISLYQQKNVELHLEGRKALNPRALFANNHFPYPSTPYLSQVPCSWGAVYFPEHWREFHAYLAERLSELTMELERVVVPDVRSNHWTKSWKKYFIELVYLRGYVMLYPNYPDFLSFSTNHLEVGSHVKDRPKEKLEVFRRPLMDLSVSEQLLLDLPGETLPRWDVLPVLNLTGVLTSLEKIRVVN
ncbi:hypothetical protein C8F04DRAFT_718749 [Mycena alexandri]|uniref:Uncharacterized protein n=1 Tax=Mycena alexandri TaxID=1745969 RepID=A0AAD6TD08_9AGAR|nr:hypothetical protein C8F04DRAFT_718749 [Mycena alexandri]